jgi:DNA replication factor GINS
MNLDELRSVQNAERRKSGLQSLRESFYSEAGEYVASLKQQRERAADRADDPFSDPEVKRLSDEIETAEEVIEAIYERRMGKLLKRASLAASEMSADEEGLTTEEQELFHDIVERIRTNKSTVLDTVSGEADGEDPPDRDGSESAAGPDDRDPAPGTEPDDGVRAADAMGSTGDQGGEPADPVGDPTLTESRDEAPEPTEVPPGDPPGGDTAPPGDTAPSDGHAKAAPAGGRETATEDGGGSPGVESQRGTDRVTVRITRDVGEIFGVDDRQYDLASEDVVQLPEQNADPLVRRDAAERLD